MGLVDDMVCMEERLGRMPFQNGHYAPNGRLKFRRCRASVVRDFPLGCGPSSVPLNLAIGMKEVLAKNFKKGAEIDTERGNDSIRFFGSKVEFSSKDVLGSFALTKTAGHQDNWDCVDEKLVLAPDKMNVCSLVRLEPHLVDGRRPKKVRTIVLPLQRRLPSENINVLQNANENLDGPIVLESVEAQPLSMCSPNDETSNFDHAPRHSNEVNLSTKKEVSSKSLKKKYPFGGKVSTVRDFPPSIRMHVACVDLQEIGKVDTTTKNKNLVLEKLSIEKQRKKNTQEGNSNAQILENQGLADTSTKGIVAWKRVQSLVRQVSNQSTYKCMSQENFETLGSEEAVAQGLIPSSKLVRKPIHGAIAQRPRKFNVRLPHPNLGGLRSIDKRRNKKKETLRLFQAMCRKLLQEKEGKPQDGRVDQQASRILKEKGKLNNLGEKIIGNVPGIEVGDEFQYRMELNVIGLHKPTQGGIDYVKEGRQILATSIVASGRYDDELDDPDVLVYTGQGGNVLKGGKDPEDQKLERGNLALANSKNAQNPVRVIRGVLRALDSSNSKGKAYVYDGLYLVDDFWRESGPHGKLVFKFKLRRIPGQPELSWKVLKESKKSNFRKGLCKLDISEGKERIPICAVNDIDNERPPSFIYTVNMMYPNWCHPIPPKGCNCTTRCSESRKCSCVDKNGEISYNCYGAIVEAKPLVYECGPLCKCPPSCYNRVTQHGIKFKLEIFKTETRGWGVRSLDSIPSGSFICEYVGELLEDKEAERRTSNDEYLFDIGINYNNSLWDVVSKLMPDTRSTSKMVVDGTFGFTVDAARYGNVGRFINHSCSPNLYAQNVLFDHGDTRIPHVMFFAMDNIPPLQELTYHYNYIIGQVRDNNGNIKRKDCYCGSSECAGRLY